MCISIDYVFDWWRDDDGDDACGDVDVDDEVVCGDGVDGDDKQKNNLNAKCFVELLDQCQVKLPETILSSKMQ